MNNHTQNGTEKFYTEAYGEDAMGTVLETLGAAGWTIYSDREGNVQSVIWSNELRRLLGYSEAEFPNTVESSYELVHPDDFSYAFHDFWKALNDTTGAIKYDVEYRLKEKSGQYRWFRGVGKYASAEPEDPVRVFHGIVIDIDAQKKHEEEIQQNLHIMSVLNKEYSAVYFVDFEKDSYTCYVNDKTEDESTGHVIRTEGGYSATMERCILNLVSEKDRSWLSEMVDLEMVKKRLEIEHAFSVRYRAADNANGQTYFEMRFVRCGNFGKSCQAVIGFRCVDDVIRKEEKMKQKVESEHRERDYQKLLILHNALRSCMWGFDFDADGKLINIESSEAFCMMMGLQKSDFPLTFDKCLSKIYLDDRVRIASRAYGILAHPNEDEQYSGEFRVQYENRICRWFHVSGKVFAKSNGTYSFMGVLTDVDEEKTLQKTLSEEVAQLEKTRDELREALKEANLNNEIVSAIAKIYWLIYRMDLRTDTYEEISSGEEMHRLTGKRGNTTEVFKDVRENVVAAEYQDIMREFLDTSTLADRMKNEESISIEYLAASGQWHLGRFIVKKRDENGRVINVLYVAHEIDERKRKELEYQQKMKEIAEEAKRANIAKTDFLRRMSHDIRTPINGIRGMVEIENHYANDVEKLRECRMKIWEASGYLLSLVNNVLDMNKLESGNIILEEESFDLYQLLNENQTVVEMQAVEYGVNYSMDISSEQIPHQHLLGSTAHLKQILMNLASNAVKYNRKDGQVSISCKELSCDGKQAIFQFICADTGIGMSEEFQRKAFEPFSQEKKDARSTFTGSGLGLSITKNLVEYMGGTIELHSEENVGTTFVVTLPFKIDRNPAEEQESHFDATIDGSKVLLVEDNALNMEIARFMLENNGLVVTGASNGQEAVDIFAASQPGEFDVIFMDIMMPVMGGLDATKVIRGMDRPDAKTIPIFAMTANAFKDDILASAEAGMNEHLTKPLDENRIVNALRQYVRR